MDDLSKAQDIIDSVSASITSQEQVLGHLSMLADVCEKKKWREFENTIRLSIVCLHNNMTDDLFNNEGLIKRIRDLEK
jgi:hypothetical protein